MADSRRELIIKNIVTTLQGITVLNGYHHDVDQVLRTTQAVQSFIGTPTNVKSITLWVLQNSEQKLQEGAQSKITRQLFVTIGFLLRHEPEVDGILTSELANQVSQDIYKALMVDESRGGLAWGVESFESLDSDQFDDVGSGLVRNEEWSWIYEHSVTDESVA